MNVKISRTELVLILLISLAGCVARGVHLGDVAVEHFDEGVYASNLWFPNDDFAYPDRHLYAPPLVPALIEWSMILFGAGAAAPILPGVLLGSLTVPLLWLVTRRWFGPAAGVAAASLLALSDFHIAMSRSALTDVPLVFFLLLAVWLIHEGVSQGRFGVAIAGGLAAGLAWATKYNGWLPLAIGVSGTAGAFFAQRVLFKHRGGSEIKTRSVSEDAAPTGAEVTVALAAAIIIAAVTWYPVWSSLPNDYSEVSSNHSRYVVGLSGWLPSLVQHESIQRHYAGLATWLSGLLAAVSAALVLRATSTPSPLPPGERGPEGRVRGRSDPASAADGASDDPLIRPSATFSPGGRRDDSSAESSTWNGEVSRSTILMAATLTGAIALSPIVVLLAWSLVSFVTLILRAVRSSGSNNAYWLALWFGLAWLIGLLIATPLYRPYPRLLLPLQCVAMIGTALAVVMLLSGQVLKPDSGDNRSSSSSRMRFAWLLPVFLLCAWRGYSTGAPAWQTRTELAKIASDATAAAATDCQGESSEVEGFDFVLYIYGEPGLLHHVPPANARAFVQAVMDLSFTKPGYRHAKIPAFVLAGPHALDSLEFQKQLAEAGEALEQVEVYPYRASDFVLLDDVPVAGLERQRAQFVRLYRVHFR